MSDELRAELALDRVVAADAPAGTRDRVRELAEGLRASGDEGGAHAFRDLMLAAGAPAPRVFFGAISRALGATPKRRDAVARKLAKFVPSNRGLGCIEVDFPGAPGAGRLKAYLVLDECGADHDLGAELAKIDPHVDEKSRAQLRLHLAQLVRCGRGAYLEAVRAASAVFDAIRAKLPDGFDPLALPGVAHDNTALYIGIPGSRRVGIFVRLEAEVPPPRAAV